MRKRPNAVQVVIAVIGWAIFVVAWLVTLGSGTVGRDWLIAACVVGAVILVVLGLTLLWVRHNVALYRRQGPRADVPRVIHDSARDAQGIPVVGNLAALRSARYVIVDVEHDAEGSAIKTYQRGSAELSEEEWAACTLS